MCSKLKDYLKKTKAAAGQEQKRVSFTKAAEPDIYTGFKWEYDFFS
ncbi:MAG: hypothetical protein K2O91_06575 [Lachnospiraceae bacterium]|nr:hypothetical protein [Lachnospiraceae bacterium]